MNREILFKGFHPCENGKDKVFINDEWISGEWIEGNRLYDEITDKHYIVPFGNINESQKVGQEGCCYCVGFEVIPETVGQYTGLTDKNGKKIFEGDILKFTNDEGDSSLYSVQWSDFFAGWVMQRVEMTFEAELMDCWNDWRNYCEVIGNIHANSELLEAVAE